MVCWCHLMNRMPWFIGTSLKAQIVSTKIRTRPPSRCTSGVRGRSPQCKLECHSGQPAHYHAWAALKLIPTPMLLCPCWAEGRHCTNMQKQNSKCKCCRLRLVQQLCCPNCCAHWSTEQQLTMLLLPYSISSKMKDHNKQRSPSKDKVGTICKHIWESIHCCLHEWQHAGCMRSTRNKDFWWRWLRLSSSGRWGSCLEMPIHDGRPYRDAQDRLLWKDKTCPART